MRFPTLSALILAAAIALSGPLSSAPVEPATAAAPAVAKPPPVPLLWKVSDADNAIYVLGSFHLLRASDYPLSTDVDRAFAAADKVMFEVPPEEMFDPGVSQRFLDIARYGDGRRLSQELPADLREKLNRVLAKNGRSLSQFDLLEPWFVNLSLVLGVSQSLGFSPQLGLDQYLMRQAAEAGKPTGGLETMERQLQLMDASPVDEQIDGLREFLEQPEKVPGMLEDMHAAWRNGDLATLDRDVRQEMQDKQPQSYRQINIERNQAWLPQLRKLLDDSRKGDVLVVVGALHLLGQDGLIEHLRAQGYRIERVCSACAAGTADLAPAATAPAPAPPAVRVAPPRG